MIFVNLFKCVQLVQELAQLFGISGGEYYNMAVVSSILGREIF